MEDDQECRTSGCAGVPPDPGRACAAAPPPPSVHANIDQYRVSKDEQGNIASDPNRLDAEEYIVRLIGQVITVSLETLKIIGSLPKIEFS